MQRTINSTHKAEYEPIADLITYRVMPTRSVPMNVLDPFIFLNHHGRQVYKPNNRGLPFGPHPHRGFETLTFIIEGDLTHQDSSGGASIIKEGGIQWMTAGSGLIHSEVSSNEFKQQGGPVEILQLWMNLLAKHKMTSPSYVGAQQNEIPAVYLDEEEKARAYLISGQWNHVDGIVHPLTDISVARIDCKKGAFFTLTVQPQKNIFLYVVKGIIEVNGKQLETHQLPEFNHDGDRLEISTTEDSIILLGYATPFNEPFVAYGPFVMNTQEEIQIAYQDYHAGKFA